jgi:hypothetical protein
MDNATYTAPSAEDLAEIKAKYADLFARTIKTWANAGAPAGADLIDAIAQAATDWLANYEATIAGAADTSAPKARPQLRIVSRQEGALVSRRGDAQVS